MIRESIHNRTRAVPRPLLRPLRQAVRRPPAGKPRPARRPERFPALDNARFVLIALVVVGHLLEQLVQPGPLADALYRWIYLFHMPAFILISGAVARPKLDRRRLLGLLTGLLVPYLVFQTLYPAWDAWLSGSGDWSQGYLVPYWLLWYLPSLACWRLLLPAFTRLGRWALPLALLVAVAAGLGGWIGYPFSLSRTLVWFPLFVLGHRVGAAQLQRTGALPARRLVAAGVLVAAALAAWWLRGSDPRWLYASFDYAALGATPVTGVVVRLGLLAASSACALAVLALVPRQPCWHGAGQRSLAAYLLHGFLVLGLAATGVFAWLQSAVPEPVALLVWVVAGGAVAALLCTRAVDRLARPLLRPVAWLRECWPARGAHKACTER